MVYLGLKLKKGSSHPFFLPFTSFNNYRKETLLGYSLSLRTHTLVSLSPSPLFLSAGQSLGLCDDHRRHL